jgi:MYXO-CTERM domain-containing protein
VALYGAQVDVPQQAAAMQGLAEGMTAAGCSTAPSGPMALLGLAGLLAFGAGRRRTPLPAPARARARR